MEGLVRPPCTILLGRYIAPRGTDFVAEGDMEADGRGSIFNERCLSRQAASLHLAGAFDLGGTDVGTCNDLGEPPSSEL